MFDEKEDFKMKNGPFKNHFIGKSLVLFCLVIHGCRDTTSDKEPMKGKIDERPVERVLDKSGKPEGGRDESEGFDLLKKTLGYFEELEKCKKELMGIKLKEKYYWSEDMDYFVIEFKNKVKEGDSIAVLLEKYGLPDRYYDLGKRGWTVSSSTPHILLFHQS